jgi:hypothetical protein
MRTMSRLAALSFLISFAACEKTVYVTAPDTVIPDYIVVTDTSTSNLPNTLGGQWQISLTATATGNVEDLASERFAFLVDKPELVKVSRGDYSPVHGYSIEAQASTVTFNETVLIKGIGVGTAKITAWHPSAPKLKRIFIMKISQ